MRTVLLGLGLCFLACTHLCAQCPGRAALRSQLQEITSTGYDSLALVRQRQRLESWLSTYQNCYPQADSNYVSTLSELARVHYYSAYFFNNDIAPAIACSQQAIDAYNHPSLALKISDLVLAHYRLGIYYGYDDRADESILALSKAIELGRNQPQAAVSLNSAYPYVIGYYYKMGDYERALQYALEGESVAYQVGDPANTSKLLQQKAQVLGELGRLPEARQAIEKAISLIRPFPEHHRTLTGAERQLGGILYDMGELGESISHLYSAYALAKKNHDENLSDFATALGRVYLDLGDDARALGYFQEALRIDRTKSSKSILLDFMAVLRRKQKDFDLALTYHQQGFNNLSIGYCETNVTALPAARLIQSEARPDYFLIIVQDKANTWLEYAKHKGDDREKLKNAWRTYMLADSMIDIMRSAHSGEMTKLMWRSRARSMYERAIETCYLLEDPAAALHFFEKSRAVLLNDQLNERIAEQSLTRKDRVGVQSLRRELRFLQKKSNEKSPTNSSSAELNTSRFAVQRAYEDLVSKLKKKNPAYRRFRNDNHVPGLDEIRQNLLTENGDCHSVFISYFVGDSAIYGIGIDEKRFIFKKLNAIEYRRHIGKFKELLVSRAAQNSHWAAYQQAAYGLYQTLILPFDLEKGTKLIVSPDGDFIPFAALVVSPQKSVDYLVQHHAISYAYSAGFLGRVPRTVAGWWPSFRTFLGMAPVDFAPALQQTPLPGSDNTLKEIGSRFLFPKKLVGKEASRKAFATLAPGYRIVQLFTHASADSSGVAPKLYFADSVFRLSDLPDTTFRTQLMVLAACQTGIGQNQRGEGVFSLARGFAAVGIPSTLTTLWSVEDQPTYGLTSLFYSQLADGLPLDEALQQAQIEWLKSDDPADQMPYAWAGVVLVGQRAPLGRYYGVWVYGGGVILFALLAGLFLWTKRRKRLRDIVASAHRASLDSS